MEVSWGRAGEVSARHSMAAAPGVEVIGASQDLVCGAWKPPRQCTKTETVWACPNESACRDLFGGSPFPFADATPLPSPPKFPTMKRNADNKHPMPSLKQPETSRPSTTKTFEVQHARQLTCIKVLGISCQHILTSWTLGTKKVSRHPLEARSRVSHRTKLLQLYDSPCSEPARGSRQLGHVPCSRGGTSKTPGLLMSPAENWRDWHVTRGGERGDWGRRTDHTTHDSSLTHAIIGWRP